MVLAPVKVISSGGVRPLTLCGMTGLKEDAQGAWRKKQ